MPNLAQVGFVVGVVSLVLASNGGTANAGMSSICVAAEGSAASLLVQVKDKKSKKNGHEDSGLTECTIIGEGGGGGCKSGFNWKCEKLKSGKRCCGCVADKSTKPQGGQGNQGGQGDNNNVLWGDYFQTDPKPAQTGQPETGSGKDDGTFYGRYQNGAPPQP